MSVAIKLLPSISICRHYILSNQTIWAAFGYSSSSDSSCPINLESLYRFDFLVKNSLLQWNIDFSSHQIMMMFLCVCGWMDFRLYGLWSVVFNVHVVKRKKKKRRKNGRKIKLVRNNYRKPIDCFKRDMF